jgi:hypothetical protein
MISGSGFTNSDMDAQELKTQFDVLQKKLRPLWQMIGRSDPGDLFEITGRHRLHYDHTSQTGVVLQLISSVAALGMFGATVIADSPTEADALYHRLLQVMDDEAKAALGQ